MSYLDYLIIAVFSACIALLMVRLAIYVFPKVGLMDRPAKYGLKRAPIPYYGGIAIVLSFLIGCLIWLKLDWKLIVFLGLGLFVAVVSFIDDRKGISPYWRLLMQIGAGVGIFAAGIFVRAFPNPIGSEIPLTTFQWGGIAIFSLLITVAWVVLIMNTINWIDGLNGLPSGVSAIASLTIFFLTIKPGVFSVDQTSVAIMALILGVVMLTFAFFDFYPAKILMGDTGSMFLGYILAGLAIYSGGKLATAFLVLGVPILDSIWIIMRRILAKKSPFKGDLEHFHHRLLYAGFSHRQALLVNFVVAGIFGGLAIILGSGQKIWAVVGLMALMATLGLLVVILDIEKKRKKG